jgi:hypothetical protein
LLSFVKSSPFKVTSTFRTSGLVFFGILHLIVFESTTVAGIRIDLSSSPNLTFKSLQPTSGQIKSVPEIVKSGSLVSLTGPKLGLRPVM